MHHSTFNFSNVVRPGNNIEKADTADEHQNAVLAIGKKLEFDFF